MKQLFRMLLLSFVLFFSSMALPTDFNYTISEVSAEAIEIETDLEDGLNTKADKQTFDLFATDTKGNKISTEYIAVTNNDKNVAVNWDDNEKTSYTLDLEVGENHVVIAIDYEGETATKEYTITREAAEDGETIGQYVFAIEGFSIGIDHIVEPVLVDVKKGQTASYALNDAILANGFEYDNSGSLDRSFYLEYLIDGTNTIFKKDPKVPEVLLEHIAEPPYYDMGGMLGEFDFNSMSGWMYSVNNSFPNVGFADYYLKDEDVMRVQFTLGLGADIGGGMGGRFFNPHNKDDLTREIAKINSGDNKEEYLNISVINQAYNKGLQSLYQLDAVQADLNKNLLVLSARISEYEELPSEIKQLKQAIETTKQADRTNKTKESIANLEAVIADAEALLTEDSLTTAELDAVIVALNDAVDSLVEIPVNYNKLDEAIEKAEKVDVANKTKDSIAALEQAIEDAKAIKKNTESTQAEVTKAVEVLDAAVKGLTDIPVDSSILEAAIDEAEKADTTNKTKDSIATLDQAIEDARAIKKNAESTQAEVTKAIEVLDAAVKGLTEIPVDFSKLDQAIDEAEKADKTNKTRDSIEALDQAIEDAKAIKKNTESTQAEVTKAVEVLDAAVKGLTEIPVDFSKLDQAIDEAEKADKTNKTKDSITKLDQVISDAKSVLDDKSATQTEVDASIKALNTAIKGLENLPSSPQQTIGTSHNVHSSEYDYGVEFWHDDIPDIGFYINAASNFILLEVDKPNFGTTSGEWSVMSLLRGMYTGADYINQIPNNYFDDYRDRVFDLVDSKDGNLSGSKSTEWSRTILAMNAMNEDITNIAGYNFIEKLSESHEFSHKQGINGPIFALIAMNTGRDKLYGPENNSDANTEGKMIDEILSREITHQNTSVVGGWSLAWNLPDPDITGMALQGFAPYYLDKEMFDATDSKHSYEDFAEAVERGIVALKQTQLPDGSFPAIVNTNSESTTQAIVALTELNIDPLTEKYLLPHINQIVSFKTKGTFQDGVFTNNMIDALLTFWADGSFNTKSKANGESYAIGGFKHIKSGNDGGGGSGAGVNGMATDQSLYGLIAYDRFVKGENKLYNMQDMLTRRGGKSYDTFKPTEYSMNLYLNKNKEKLENETPKNVSPYELIELPELESTGKKVIGWTNRTDGEGKLFEPGTLLSIPDLEGMGNELNLHAVYDMDQFKVTLNSDGGTYDESAVPSTITVEDTIKLPTKNEISKKGYEFIGWYENKGFTSDRQIELKETKADVELYAKWDKLEVDKQELKKAIKDAEKVNLKGMTQDSVSEFNQSIDSAKALRDNKDVKQKAVDEMTEKLNQAEEKLIVDKSELEEKIKEGKKVLE